MTEFLSRSGAQRDPGYSAPSRASVYALAEPDPEPLPAATRTGLVWDGPDWTEIDPATGVVLATGVAPLDHDHGPQDAGHTQEPCP